ncbi:hypothetical protein R3P38DRAFT_3003083 [Favolaschia claudopus]|uniref:C2H2-type domain-containing protein n=1 Tax=Favolaschia claudopus TaxID=2862362 RepID=A0AAW0AP18_9AGAR
MPLAEPPNWHRFIDCPTDGCPLKIPEKLVCRGHYVPYHAGLEYQACKQCGFLGWLAPDEVAAAERRWQNSPAGGAPPVPPPDYPYDPEYAASPPPSPFNPNAIDPALQQPSYLAPPFTQPFSSLPSSVAAPPQLLSLKSGKARCAAKSCSKQAGASSCTHRMCKQCCEQQAKGCQYGGHRKNQNIAPAVSMAASALGDPSALSRPTPMHAYEPIDAHSVPTPTSLPPKVYKKPMDPQWAVRYNENHAAQQQRKQAEEQRRAQDLMYERQIRFCFWSADGVEPEMFRQQGLSTLRLNMANYPALLKKMGLSVDEEIGVYDFTGRCWDREDVSHVREVVPQEVLLVRRFGVTDCSRLDEYIEKYAPKPAASRRALLQPSSKRKHVVIDVDASPEASTPTRRPKVPRRASPLPHASPPSSPSPSSRSSPAPLSPTLSSSPSIATASSATPTDPDAMWDQGRVLNPIGCGAWPDGMFARDMAKGFGLVGSSKVADRFVDVFGGTFPKGTWYQQQRAWKYSSQAERDQAAALPRSAEGLWTVWRGKSSGWARVCEEKREKRR